MRLTTRPPKVLGALLVGLTAASVFMGCGAVHAPTREQVREPSAPPEARCFLRAGGRLADNLKDVSFFTRLRRKEARLNFGAVAFTKTHTIIESAPAPVTASEASSPSGWLLYAGWPSQRGQVEVEEILSRHLRDSFVVYLRNPSKIQRRQAMSCMEKS